MIKLYQKLKNAEPFVPGFAFVPAPAFPVTSFLKHIIINYTSYVIVAEKNVPLTILTCGNCPKKEPLLVA